MKYYKRKSNNVFERRVAIISFIAKSKSNVSNIDLQLKFGLSKETLNNYLHSLVEFGYLRYVKDGNSYLYTTTDFAKTVFKED